MEENKKEDSENISKENTAKINNNPDKIDFSKYTKKIKKNPWILSSIIFAIIALILLIMVMTGCSITGNAISGEIAGEKITEYLNSRTGGGVEYVSYEDNGNLYQVTVKYQGQQIPVYVTKDGEYFVQGAIPMTQTQEPIQNEESEPQNVPKSDKPEVELFIMSHCPYGTQAMKGIIPAFELLGDKINGKIKFVNYAMHGEKEVYEQLNQYCIQKEQSDKYLPYLKCFLGSTGSADDAEKCLTQLDIDRTKLNSCTSKADEEFDITKNLENKSSWSNGRFPLFNIHNELNQEYGVRGSPTLVINGEQISSSRNPSAYLNIICSAFNEQPEECNTELDSSNPSPGFGYETTSSGNANAQCA